MFRKLIRLVSSFSLLATLLVGVSVASTVPAAAAVPTCAEGGACVVGDTGPGGGKVFYVSPSIFTSSGSLCGSSCLYLEAVLNCEVSSWADTWDRNVGTSASLGTGYSNTKAVIDSGATSGANYQSWIYTNNGLSDWFLPSIDELKLLYAARTTLPFCSGGNSLSSTQYSATQAIAVDPYASGATVNVNKAWGYLYRTIRAFSSTPVNVDQATVTVNAASGTYGSTVSLASTGGSGTGAVTFATTSTSCSISGTTLSVSAAVTCSVTATKAASTGYNAVTSASVNIAFAKAIPSVSLQYPNSNTIAYSLGGTLSPTSFSRSSSGAISFSTTSPACSIDSSTAVISIVAAGVCDAYINVAEDGNFVARSSYTRVTISGLTGLTPTFDTATATASGFTVNITNFSSDFAFNTTIDTATVTVGIATGSILPLTISGLAPGSSATISITTTRVGYLDVLTTFNSSSISNKTVTFKPNFAASPPSDATQSSNIPVNLSSNVFVRTNFTFIGWNTNADGTGTPYVNNASFNFASNLQLFAQWVQNSLYGIAPSDLTLVGSLTAAGINSSFEGSTGGGTVAVQYETGSLPTGTVINIHLLSNTSRAASLIRTTNSFILSFVVSWLTLTGTVPSTDPVKPLRMTISNALIKKGASVYSLIGPSATLVATATVDGSVTFAITDDPEIVIAIRKPDAPTGVLATSGANASAVVTWTAPANNGGAEIDSYRVTSNEGQTCAPSSLSSLMCTVSGLTNGTDYTFTVTASNSAGISDSSTASIAIRPLAPVVAPTPTAPSSSGSGYATPAPDPAIAAAAQAQAAAAAAAYAIAMAKEIAEAKAAAEAKALAELKAIEDAKLAEGERILALIKQIEVAQIAADLKKAEEAKVLELAKAAEEKLASELLIAEIKRIASEQALLAAKRITTVYSTTAVFKLNKTYTKRLSTYTKKIASGSTVTCIGYAKSSKTLPYAKAKIVASKQAKALCLSMKKINPTLMTKSTVLPASKAPLTKVNRKWIPVSYRVEAAVN